MPAVNNPTSCHRRANGLTGGRKRPPGVPASKPGTRGGFKPGFDPRRAGATNEEFWNLQREAARLAPEALGKVYEVMTSKTSKPSEVLAAANVILGRGFGAIPQSIDLTLAAKPRDIRTLSTAELEALALGAAPRTPLMLSDGTAIIDAEVPDLSEALPGRDTASVATPDKGGPIGAIGPLASDATTDSV